MDPRAGIVCWLEEIVEVCWNAHQVVTITVCKAASTREVHIFLDGLEEKIGRRGGAPPFTESATGANGRQGRVRAVPGVYVLGAVGDHIITTYVVGCRPVFDLYDTAVREVRVGRGCRSAAQSRIGDGDNLR